MINQPIAEQITTDVKDSELPEIPYPPAPWRMSGQMWMGMFPTDSDVTLPAGLNHLGNPRQVMVMLVRYLEGTLRYDELAIGALARRGRHFGIWVNHIWVDSLESVWGGRHIWGLPKDMAEFTWTGNQVEVSDKQGKILTLAVDTTPSRWPAIWMPAPGFGRIGNDFVFTMGSVWAHPGSSAMRIEDWSSRFSYRPEKNTPGMSFAGKPFRMTVPASNVLR